MYAVRLRSIYENGMPNVIDILFESKGITDFFSKLNVYQSVVEYDKSMVNNTRMYVGIVHYVILGDGTNN